MTQIRFFVQGQPRGKGRPRHMKNGHVYTDQKTRDYENLIWTACKSAMKGVQPFEHAAQVTIRAVMKVPASASKRAKTAMLCGMAKPESKPDLDNIIKAVLDGCNGVAFRDDKQVVSIRASKEYGETPGVEVIIEEEAQ